MPQPLPPGRSSREMSRTCRSNQMVTCLRLLATTTSPWLRPAKSASQSASVAWLMALPPQTMTTIDGACLGGASPGDAKDVDGIAARRMTGS